MPAIPLLGIMVSRGSRWVIHSWLRRHAAMFEKLAVLEGSPAGSVDAAWAEQQCASYTNVVFSLEENANMSAPPTDQTTRAAAMQLLGLGEKELIGRWILNCHPDEFWLLDVRVLAAHVAMRDPQASCVLVGAAYPIPTRSEFEAIESRHSEADGHRSFEPIDALGFVDAE